MAKLSRIRRCVQLPRNTRGRDLLVGDLHGHRHLLERQLDELRFDPLRDRVISVGDLVDRGPSSLDTLRLLEEPWFHAVIGNHELMLLNFLGYFDSRLHSAKGWSAGGGAWIRLAMDRHRRLVRRLADRIAELPVALYVPAPLPFTVTHGDLVPIGRSSACLFAQEDVCVHRADLATSSRANIQEALTRPLSCLSFAGRDVHVSDTPLGALPITYAGHSPVDEITVHNSYVYIDQGVGGRVGKQRETRLPTVIDHLPFSLWLNGAASAHGRDTDLFALQAA